MRDAFSMLTAVVMIVMMAGLAALVTNVSSKIVKETTGQYRYEQAALLAKSYTEYAILAIQGHGLPSNTNSCLRTITANIGGDDTVDKGENYRVEVKIQYIGLRKNIPTAGCSVTTPSVTNKLSYGFQTPDSASDTNSGDISATIDVYVMYHDIDLAGANGGTLGNDDAWLTYHRRTLQKL